MEVYLRTRGDRLEHGYRWLRLATDLDTAPAFEEPLIAQKPEVNSLAYTEHFSLVLTHTGAHLSLLVTGLERTAQSQRQRRNVRNSLACIGSWTTDECRLRSIAVAALDGSLGDLVDAHIMMIAETPGFRVDSPALIQALLEIPTGACHPPAMLPQLAPDNALARQQLSAELRQHRLPERYPYLVVVTQYRTRETLAAAHVWRGVVPSTLPAERVTHPQPFFPTIALRRTDGGLFCLPDELATNPGMIMLSRQGGRRRLEQKWREALNPLLAYYALQLYIVYLRSAPEATGFQRWRHRHGTTAEQYPVLQHEIRLREILRLPQSDTLTLYLVERSGQILWQAQGEYDETRLHRLRTTLADLTAQ